MNKKKLYFSLISPLIAGLFLISCIAYFSLNIAQLGQKSQFRIEEAECMRISPYILREQLLKGLKEGSFDTFHRKNSEKNQYNDGYKVTLKNLKSQEGYYQITVSFFSQSNQAIFEETYYVF